MVQYISTIPKWRNEVILKRYWTKVKSKLSWSSTYSLAPHLHLRQQCSSSFLPSVYISLCTALLSYMTLVSPNFYSFIYDFTSTSSLDASCFLPCVSFPLHISENEDEGSITRYLLQLSLVQTQNLMNDTAKFVCQIGVDPGPFEPHQQHLCLLQLMEKKKKRTSSGICLPQFGSIAKCRFDLSVPFHLSQYRKTLLNGTNLHNQCRLFSITDFGSDIKFASVIFSSNCTFHITLIPFLCLFFL